MVDTGKGIRIMRIIKRLKYAVKDKIENSFKAMNLTAPQGMIIGTLSRFGPMKISDLSKHVALSNSTVSGIIDRLEKHGFVERTRSESDRRVVLVCITEKFKDESKQHHNDVKDIFEELLNNATEEEIDTIMKGLDVLEKVIDKRQDEEDL
ncbi:MAG: MarR family transcriptional regulator [Firmicutes bacterium]|nr:MarR family transcriptional regulator [Bacillota bacterium]